MRFMMTLVAALLMSVPVYAAPTTTPTSTPPAQTTQNSTTSSINFAARLASLLQSLFASQNTPQLETNPGVKFGGPVLPGPRGTGPVLCTTPPGAFYVEVGPPTPAKLICQPGTCYTYLYPPPYSIGQFLLGVALPTTAQCFQGKTYVGTGNIIANTPGVGSSGAPVEEETPATPSQCTDPNITDQASQAAAEKAVRDRLKECSGDQIKIVGSKTNTPCGYGVNGVDPKNGCTSVAGLQCGAIQNLCDLYKQCGAFTITGGSEGGHGTHSAGNAVDVSSNGGFGSTFSQCVEKLGAMSGGKFVDQVTKTTYLPEQAGQTSRTTGPHWHICYSGTGC